MKHKSGALQIRAFDYEVKSADDAGFFSGYGSVFGVVDSYNEVVAPGAFLESLDGIRAKGRSLPVLWQHRSGEPIGNWDMTTLKEDTHGLNGNGQLWLDDAPYAKLAQRGMKTKAITGLSIGYYVRDSSLDEKTRIRTLTKLDLVEISIVTNPANDDARIDAVKALLSHGTLPDIRSFEKYLHEIGFSRKQAEVISACGYKHLLGQGDPAGGGVSQTIELLSSFSLKDK